MARIFGKQTATLDEWVAVPDTHDPVYFTGRVRNHPRQSEFRTNRQSTSTVVAFDLDNGLLETRNTIYRLGKPLN